MTGQPAIRGMQWTDLGAVAELERRIHPDHPWREATWWAELAHRPRRHYLLAERSELSEVPSSASQGRDVGDVRSVVGYAGLDVSGDHADVMTIAVDPGERGTGLGSALLRALHDEARSRQVQDVLLEVRADNEGAHALYARHGYRRLHTRPGYYQPDGVDAIVLRVTLTLHGGLDPTRYDVPSENTLTEDRIEGSLR